jgi:hypothetical protein
VAVAVQRIQAVPFPLWVSQEDQVAVELRTPPLETRVAQQVALEPVAKVTRVQQVSILEVVQQEVVVAVRPVQVAVRVDPAEELAAAALPTITEPPCSMRVVVVRAETA